MPEEFRAKSRNNLDEFSKWFYMRNVKELGSKLGFIRKLCRIFLRKKIFFRILIVLLSNQHLLVKHKSLEWIFFKTIEINQIQQPIRLIPNKINLQTFFVFCQRFSNRKLHFNFNGFMHTCSPSLDLLCSFHNAQ